MDLVTDWLSLAVRWLHIIFGAAWIGTSFYFNWLNNHVREPEDASDPTLSGELWSVHGGAFYRVMKYRVAPEKLPKILHWFKYEAYFTWVSGFALLIVVYYLNAKVYLIDARVYVLEPWQAVSAGIGSLVLSWLVYHGLCMTPLAKKPTVFALFGFVLMTAVAYGLTNLFGSRAAYIHVGAIVGTLMAANVFFVIIPNQKVTVAAMMDRKEPDPKYGAEAAMRSLHNNYFTLPVLFIMVSNHYPFTFGHKYNWAILAALSLIGAGTRHWFNLRGQGQRNVWLLPVAALAMVALAFVTKPKSYADYRPVSYNEVRTIIDERCVTCHSSSPTFDGYKQIGPPQGLVFDTEQDILTKASHINTQVVVTKQMPLSNLTGITDEEREAIGAWFYQGAKGSTP